MCQLLLNKIRVVNKKKLEQEKICGHQKIFEHFMQIPYRWGFLGNTLKGLVVLKEWSNLKKSNSFRFRRVYFKKLKSNQVDKINLKNSKNYVKIQLKMAF